MATFSDEQRAFIREVVREVLVDVLPNAMVQHTLTCPYGARLTRATWVVIGVCIGANVLSAAVAPKLLAFFAGVP